MGVFLKDQFIIVENRLSKTGDRRVRRPHPFHLADMLFVIDTEKRIFSDGRHHPINPLHPLQRSHWERRQIDRLPFHRGDLHIRVQPVAHGADHLFQPVESGKHHNQCKGSHADAHDGDPRDDVDEVVAFLCQQIPFRYEQRQVHGWECSRLSMFSI